MSAAATVFAVLFWCNCLLAFALGIGHLSIMPPILAAVAIAAFHVWGGWRAGDESSTTSTSIAGLVVSIVSGISYLLGRAIGAVLE